MINPCSLLLLLLLAFRDGMADSAPGDATFLVQGSVFRQQKQLLEKGHNGLSVLQGDHEEAEEVALGQAAKVAEGAEAVQGVGTAVSELSTQASGESSTAGSTGTAHAANGAGAARAEVHRKALKEELDAVTNRLMTARKVLRKAQKTAEAAQKKIKGLEDENITAMLSWDKAHTKRESWVSKAQSTRLKQAEREGLKGKHLSFDHDAYRERIRKGNLSTYGLWNPSDEEQHVGEKTWDILSNHIFGLDKLMKHLSNATDYEQKAKKYHKQEQLHLATAAAAKQELQDNINTIKAADAQAAKAKEDIANLMERRSEILPSMKNKRRQGT